MPTAAIVQHRPAVRRAPQVITVRTRAPAKPKTKHRRVAGRAMSPIIVAIAGFVLGQVDKGAFGNIPTIPVLGRAGTIALGLHFFGKGNKLMRHGAIAAAAIAGYEFGSTGKISGPPSQL